MMIIIIIIIFFFLDWHDSLDVVVDQSAQNPHSTYCHQQFDSLPVRMLVVKVPLFFFALIRNKINGKFHCFSLHSSVIK